MLGVVVVVAAGKVVAALVAQAHVRDLDQSAGWVERVGPRGHPVDPAHDPADAREAVRAEHADGPQPRTWRGPDHADAVVDRPGDAGDMRPVTVRVAVRLRAPLAGAVHAADNVEVGVVGLDARVHDRDVGVDPMSRRIDAIDPGRRSRRRPNALDAHRRGLGGKLDDAVRDDCLHQRVAEQLLPLAGRETRGVALDRVPEYLAGPPPGRGRHAPGVHIHVRPRVQDDDDRGRRRGFRGGGDEAGQQRGEEHQREGRPQAGACGAATEERRAARRRHQGSPARLPADDIIRRQPRRQRVGRSEVHSGTAGRPGVSNAGRRRRRYDRWVMTEPSTSPARIHGDRAAGTLLIEWSDGHETTYDATTLRWMCPCAFCRGEAGMPGWLDTAPTLTDQQTRITGLALVGRYAVQPTWGDGHATGFYSFTSLRERCPCAECTARRAASPSTGPAIFHGHGGRTG